MWTAILLIIIVLLLAALSILGYFFYLRGKEIEAEKERGLNNLGQSMELEQFMSKIFYLTFLVGPIEEMLIHSFIPIFCHKNTYGKWVHGTAHIAHPKRPRVVYSVDVVFKADEEVHCDWKTLYKFEKVPIKAFDFYYLTKVA